MENVLIIATSLSEDSKSQRLARKFASHLREQSVPCELVDLRELNLPFAGKEDSWEGAEIVSLREKIVASSHIVFSVPIYCYDVNAAAKNVIELAGRCFTKKVVGFMCTAGGRNSYMSVMGLANHLMIDFRSVIVPRFVYAVTSDWIDGEMLTPEIEGRLQVLLEDMKSIQVNSANDGELGN
ncbi:MAG: NAD(P)H-dependent oxidoreductase [Verrucomicrobiota bacterium]